MVMSDMEKKISIVRRIKNGRSREWGVTFYEVVREKLSNKTRFEQRPGGSKKQVTGVSGKEDSRKMKQQVERHSSQPMLGMANH